MVIVLNCVSVKPNLDNWQQYTCVGEKNKQVNIIFSIEQQRRRLIAFNDCQNRKKPKDYLFWAQNDNIKE